MAREVTIVVLIILAGITLNAVIGEDGIIFQAKDTKNMISNETQYDNEQLAQLQNELRDNELYSGIGIIPGTDTGGGSEGGENGTGGNQGGSNNSGGQGGSNNSQGGIVINENRNNQTGEIIGGDAQDPTIRVLDGEQIAASFYRSDVTTQILTQDKTQKVKYVLTTTVPEINNELYPSGLVREIDIENGGTLTFTKNGEYTLTAYAYDVYGQKSNAVVMWFKIEKGTTPGNGVTVSVASGNMGLNNWYTSNITIRVLGTDTGLTRVTYRVKGTAMSEGIIGDRAFHVGEIDTPEIEIANGTTFKIEIDGNFSIVAYTYDGNMRLSTSTTLNVQRDASRPLITMYKGEQVLGQGFQVSLKAEDHASDLADGTEGEGKAGKRYTYRHKLAPSMTYTDTRTQNETQLYNNLDIDKTYDMYVIVTDNAGNMSASDVISKPALWVSKNEGSIGEKGTHGTRTYYQGNIDVSLTGQDRNNVDIRRVTYSITGTTTGEGTMDGTSYNKGQALPGNEIEVVHNETKTIPIRIDGNWTITVRTYNKENVVVSTNTLEVTRDTVNPAINNISIATVKTKGEPGYYSEPAVTVQMNGYTEDTSLKKVVYIVTGTATTSGKVGDKSVTAGNVNTGEVNIGANDTFDITADGTWNVTAYVYDRSGRPTAQKTITFVRDTVAPTISAFVKTASTDTTYDVRVDHIDFGVSGQATGGGYTYMHDGENNAQKSANTHQYSVFAIKEDGIYKVITKDKAGNVSEKTLDSGLNTGTVKNFAYTGGAQSARLKPGKYKLEVWGAQGGKNEYQGGLPGIGGLGGYSSGLVSIEDNRELFVTVGEMGKWLPSGGTGAFGGGGGGGTYCIGGGGASFIAACYGTLANDGVRNATYLVAGGGGGSSRNNNGGPGGGINGGNGSNGGGTSSSGASKGNGGSTGTESGWNGRGGGGGGWFGGFAGGENDRSGGGGSGYIGGVTEGSTTAGQNSGNGKARITLVE